MGDYTAVKIDDVEAIYRGGFKLARAQLGVTSFGMQVLDLPPDNDLYPEHDHAESGQEEVFVVLRGGGTLELDGEGVDLAPDTMVRVGPQVRRKFRSGGEGLRVLALGAVPGKAYEVVPGTELGTPDPMAAQAQ